MPIWHIARLVRQLRPLDFSAVQIYYYMYLINSFWPNLKMQKGNKITFWQAGIVLVEVALMHLKDKWRKGHVSQDLDAKKGRKNHNDYRSAVAYSTAGCPLPKSPCRPEIRRLASSCCWVAFDEGWCLYFMK